MAQNVDNNMDALNGLFKTVFYRIIFNSLVGLVAVIIVIGFYLFSNQNITNLLKLIYFNYIIIFIIFIIVLGEVIIALGEMIIHHFPFKYNSIVNDMEMEKVTPTIFSSYFSGNQIRSFKYEEFLKIFKDKNGINGDYSEINFVMGGVFAGLGYIFMTVTFYLIFISFNILNIFYILIVFIAIIAFSILIKCFVKNNNFNNKDFINFIMLIISILISIILSYLFYQYNLCIFKTFNIRYPLEILLFFISFLITIVLFYQSILHISLANQINYAIINSSNDNSSK